MATGTSLERVARNLARDLDRLSWHTPSHVYNPLVYAWDGHRQYLQRFGSASGRVLLVGMNPGPWGMAQTGVPFGSVGAVRDWFGMQPRLARSLPLQHPRYPLLGMDCHREEGSGKRLWGWAAQRVGKPEAFFSRFFVWNYCPLLFLGQGRNLIPSQLKQTEQRALEAPCNAALVQVVQRLQPQAVVAFGRYAQKQLQAALGDATVVHYLLHPSPANPVANRSWAQHAEEVLAPWLPAPPADPA
ncbi:uracil-DNA glycosylase family protein [Comamonas sp. NLF-1-9]|uniref:uracil-DNA glycosylase family protein n=1 Tax=Comamonas sp. NLF-1-9 TaxID=2853163 RepID=UPI001C458286|nr:uracil-DNA glycosylase family protein [Comamonas sp. NLF-1-9]QXL85387.1 single-stranded DNA-binding protein [Comamonas sp. NLF-1-9]